MYIIPQKYKCDKCGYETMYSPHDAGDVTLCDIDGHPFCPKCLSEFLKKNIGTLV